MGSDSGEGGRSRSGLREGIMMVGFGADTGVGSFKLISGCPTSDGSSARLLRS